MLIAQVAQPVALEAAACPFSSGEHAATFRWYALFVLPTWVFKVESTLAAWHGIETFAPLWDGRQCFPGYLFVRLQDAGQIRKALAIPGVIRILPTPMNPTPITDSEISSLRTTIASKLPAEPVPYVAGSRVTIQSGPLTGVSGTVIGRGKNASIAVGVEMLGRAVKVQVDPADLEAAQWSRK